MRWVSTVALAASLAVAAPASAATVFSDNFNSETAALNYAGFANFSVAGNVDLVSTGTFGISCPGNCVDLDGSSGPGSITSLASFAFNTGDMIRLFFDLGGSQRSSAFDGYSFGFNFAGATTLLDYGFNLSGTDLIVIPSTSTTGISTSTSIAGTDPFSTRSVFFTAGSSGSLTFNFGTSSGDNIGPLLDNVRLDVTPGAVPEPSTWAFMLVGFGAIGMAMRRRRPQLAIA